MSPPTASLTPSAKGHYSSCLPETMSDGKRQSLAKPLKHPTCKTHLKLGSPSVLSQGPPPSSTGEMSSSHSICVVITWVFPEALEKLKGYFQPQPLEPEPCILFLHKSRPGSSYWVRLLTRTLKEQYQVGQWDWWRLNWKGLTQAHVTRFVFVQSLSHVWPCDPTDYSLPDVPVLHHLPEFAQTHVHWVGDDIWPPHPLLPPSLLALNLFQPRSLFITRLVVCYSEPAPLGGRLLSLFCVFWSLRSGKGSSLHFVFEMIDLAMANYPRSGGGKKV